METRTGVAGVWRRFGAAFAASSVVRWAVLVVVLLVAWLLMFWAVNLPSDSTAPAPTVASVPTNDV